MQYVFFIMFSTIFLALSAFAIAPPNVYIAGVSYGGSGCPQGTVGSLFSPDHTSLTLIFDQYVASAGPGVPITESRKACQIAADIRVPQGWSYSIASVDYRGYVDLPAGANAEQSATYYFQSSSAQAVSRTNFYGPLRKDYLNSDSIPVQTTVWSACNAVVPVNVKTSIRLTVPRGQTGAITTDSIDAKVKQIYGLQWRRC